MLIDMHKDYNIMHFEV